MNKKLFLLIACLFSSTIYAADHLKEDNEQKTLSPPQLTIPKVPLPIDSEDKVWGDWSYNGDSSDESYDSSEDDWHTYVDYQNEHRGDN